MLNADADADADAHADTDADDGRRGYGNSSPYFQYGELKIRMHFSPKWREKNLGLILAPKESE